MPLSDVIARFSTAAADGTPAGYPVTRRAQGTYATNGVFTPGGTSSLTIDACVVPFSGRVRKTMPDGTRLEDVRIIDTATPLIAEPPDVITIAGEPFAVFEVEGPVRLSGSARYTVYAARQVTP